MKETLRKLCEASRRKALDPYTEIEWPETLEREQWFTSPELISIFGTEAWETLGEAARKRLSFFEAVNFYSLNVHGEKALVAGLAARLYKQSELETSAYLHHFLEEENKHMVYFGGFCRRYAGKLYRDRKLGFAREYPQGVEDFLFYVKVLIFEELVDVFNQRQAADPRLVPLARSINRMHHLEESRHLVFGRLRVRQLFDEWAPKWSPETLLEVREYVLAYFSATRAEYVNPDVYADAGLDDPYGVAERTLAHPAFAERWRELGAGCVRGLREAGILQEEPL